MRGLPLRGLEVTLERLGRFSFRGLPLRGAAAGSAKRFPAHKQQAFSQEYTFAMVSWMTFYHM